RRGHRDQRAGQHGVQRPPAARGGGAAESAPGGAGRGVGSGRARRRGGQPRARGRGPAVTGPALATVAYGDPAAPPLVFLRGLPSEPGRARGLDALTERLIVGGPARTHRVHAVGRPARLEPGATMAEVAGLYAEMLRGRFRTPAVIMGVSTGASIALQLAVDHPDLVGSLVVAAGAAALGEDGRAVQR